MSNPQRFQNGGVVSQLNDLDPSAIFELRSPLEPKGFLVPRMTTAERESIPTPANSLLVFDTDSSEFWLYKVDEWIPIGDSLKFIPRDGTYDGFPVTGDIEFQNSGGRKLYHNSIPGNGYTAFLQFTDENGVRIRYEDEEGQSTTFESTASTAEITYEDTGSSTTNKITVGATGASYGSSDPLSAGILYGDDYSANYTNRSLVDKEYVDNAIGGGGFVPYTGAVSDVNLGNHGLQSTDGTNTASLYPNQFQIQESAFGNSVDASPNQIGVTSPAIDQTTNLTASGITHIDNASTNQTSIAFETPTVGNGTAIFPDTAGTTKTVQYEENLDLSAYVKGDGTQATDVDLNGKDLNNVSDATIAGILTLNGGYNSLLKATSGVVSAASPGVDFEPPQTGTGFVRSASGTKTYIGETGSGNVVRDTSPLLSNPTFNTQATGTNNLTGATTAFTQQEIAAASRLLFKSATTASLTGTLTETIIYSALIGANKATDGFSFEAAFTRATGTANIQYRFYVNTSNSLSGATQIATVSHTNTQTWLAMRRLFGIDGTTFTVFNSTSNTPDDTIASAAVATTGTLNPANQFYFIISAQLNNTGDTANLKYIKGER